MDTQRNTAKVLAQALRATVAQLRADGRPRMILPPDTTDSALESIEAVAGELETIAATPGLAGPLDSLDALMVADDQFGYVTLNANTHEGRRVVQVYLGQSLVAAGTGDSLREAIEDAARVTAAPSAAPEPTAGLVGCPDCGALHRPKGGRRNEYCPRCR